MKTEKITLNVPEDLHQALAQIAGVSRYTLEEVYVLTLRNGMPPMLKNVPVLFHDVLLGLNRLDDEALWDILSGRRPAPAIPTNGDDPANFRALWRAYAFALLKWRGHPVPDPREFIH